MDAGRKGGTREGGREWGGVHVLYEADAVPGQEMRLKSTG